MKKQKKLIAWSIAAVGIIGILSAAIVSPEFVANYLTVDKDMSSDRLEALQILRWFSFLIGCLLLLIDFMAVKFPERTRDAVKSPVGTMFILIFGWILLAFINYIIKQSGINTGAPAFFPFSEVSGPRIQFSGLPYSILFLIVFFMLLQYSRRFNMLHVWFAGLSLLVLGNLAQGGIVEAFYNPVDAPYYYLGTPHYQQYYHDAIKITDWHEWLSGFNVNQSGLLKHTRTHPPFVILLHYFILKLSGNSIPFLAGAFVFLSSLSIMLVYQIMRELSLSKDQAVQFAFLFSVIPAYNIYSAVSLDGVIISFSAIFLLGLIIIIKHGRSMIGITLFVVGLLIANLLTFLALFLVATACLLALREFLVNKKHDVLLALLVFITAMILVQLLINHFYGYNHVQAFITAAELEPKSLFNYPLRYLMTRLENVAAFAIFLSFGLSAILLRPAYLKLRIFDVRDDIISIFLAGIIPVLLFFLIGGLYTGEGVRILLFVYPFFLLLLRNIEEPLLRFLIAAAGVQTIIMQTFGGYYW